MKLCSFQGDYGVLVEILETTEFDVEDNLKGTNAAVATGNICFVVPWCEFLLQVQKLRWSSYQRAGTQTGQFFMQVSVSTPIRTTWWAHFYFLSLTDTWSDSLKPLPQTGVVSQNKWSDQASFAWILLNRNRLLGSKVRICGNLLRRNTRRMWCGVLWTLLSTMHKLHLEPIPAIMSSEVAADTATMLADMYGEQ